jgi:hAT family C-terminal dimerisation region
MFDDLPALAAPKSSELRDELERYLSTDPEFVPDVLSWWYERHHIYPHLSCMAKDYLSIPGPFTNTTTSTTSLTKSDCFISHVCQCQTRF